MKAEFELKGLAAKTLGSCAVRRQVDPAKAFADAMNSDSDREVAIFTEALKVPPQERDAFLERMCRGDEDLRRRLDGLLRAHDRLGSFLACADDEDLRRRIEALLRSSDRAGDFLEEPPTGAIGEGRARIAAGEKPGDSLAATLEADGKLVEAEKMRREALGLWRWRGESHYPQALAALGGLARVLMAQRRLDDAAQLLDEALSPELVLKPRSADTLFLIAGIEARRGEWSKASAAAFRGFENQPLNSGHYSMIAALMVKTRDLATYEQFCKRIFATFGDSTNVLVADQVAKACLFAPSAAVDLTLVGRLADTAVTLGAGNAGAMPFFQICKALSDYRLGHFSEAAEWARKSIDSRRKEAQGHACGVLAMACWQLGKKDEAREVIAKGDALAPRIMPASVAEDTRNAWLAWLFARIQLDEATAFVNSGSSIEITRTRKNP